MIVDSPENREHMGGGGEDEHPGNMENVDLGICVCVLLVTIIHAQVSDGGTGLSRGRAALRRSVP
eukprot:5796312-Pyramimonas_sp.AAC.1